MKNLHRSAIDRSGRCRLPFDKALVTAAIASVLSAAASGQQSPPSEALPRVVAHVPAATPTEAEHVVRFWREAGPGLWFAKDEQFDHVFRAHFLAEHEAAACGHLDAWLESPEGALALLILLDQFPRNAFRGTARMYATDAAALLLAEKAIERGYDRAVAAELRLFFYLPFAHSERLADQDRSVALSRRLGQDTRSRAEHHRDIIRRFGRFPHRNPILGRPMRPDEQAYLDHGGFAG